MYCLTLINHGLEKLCHLEVKEILNWNYSGDAGNANYEIGRRGSGGSGSAGGGGRGK